MLRAIVVTALCLSLAAASAVAARAASGELAEPHDLAQARPGALSVEDHEVERGRAALTAELRPRDPAGERVELGTDEDHQVQRSPVSEAAPARAVPEVMPAFAGADRRLHAQIVSGPRTPRPDLKRKNPLCGATRWGLKALAIAANVGCCAGGLVACVACSVGLDGVKGMINKIDCTKQCNPDCPLA
ncbi:hypothetical protein [Nannocystis punicea]|uniref:Uncharacterized protein n=1 Tax=Nannocystis punicea TaxID=2995304 RepID=A0ABY7HJI3_9BACT|nr:hypothetical protein [Nannocystis poenicansa]WAS99215.1 hypothetical protein O0S08_24060 [Nannocystis poenicansa]